MDDDLRCRALWSALPFIIVLSSLANKRIDDDLSRHIGLNGHGAHIVETLFRNTPSHAVVPTVTGPLFSFAGIVAVVASLQVVYERLFDRTTGDGATSRGTSCGRSS
ncbi:MAG TPA: hypothetical protein VMA77_24720 [Solirubrobacteraceae bacterium]|nr:hypothetical protein [Solirubrobacteraceae bacterium]